jgi:hypothetical protein
MSQQRPTVRSVAAAVNRSVATTWKHLDYLWCDDLVTWEGGKTGTLRAQTRVVRRYE